MAASDFEQGKVDFRLYIGMLFFRWQIIAVFFLWCLLAGVLYVQLTPKEYLTTCSIMFYRDPNSMPDTRNNPRWSPYESYPTHLYLLTSRKLNGRVVSRLADKWTKRMGGTTRMALPVEVKQGKALGPTLDVSVRSGITAYSEDFLSMLLEEHQAEWQSMQMESSANAIKLLEKELVALAEKIKAAEDEMIEYERLSDVTRVSLRSRDEEAYLAALIGRRRSLTTELMMMEHYFPTLKGANEGVIGEVAKMTRETGAIRPASGETEEDSAQGGQGRAQAEAPPEVGAIPLERVDETGYRQRAAGWEERRVELASLQVREKELLQNLKPEHPEVKAIRSRIAELGSQLQVAAQIEMNNLKNRYNALKIELDAIEAAEYKWQAKNMFAAQRKGELKRVAAVVDRFEKNYQSLYDRLHQTRVSEEMRVEHYTVVTPITSGTDPVWPDPMKVMLVAVVLGLGSGLGVALASHILDNKVQSIRDVERELGISYLGGVPYWVHSGLERTIRPIVTEEHSTGAVEAYRALRTTLIAALAKLNERVFFVTSADSREGKTLTVLNIATMLAQMNKKVLLVDMDLRRGRLHRSLGLDKEPGVTDVLKEGLSLKAVIRECKIDNLFLAPAGSPIEDSSELLQSSDLMNMLVEIQNDYDYICIDTSPVLRVTDTVIMTTQGIGVVVYVARVNHTPKPLIKYSLDMLKDARVLGLIMNSIEMHKVSSLYYTYQYPNYAYYSNAYAYGYNYYYDEQKGDGKKPRHPLLRKPLRGRSAADRMRRTFFPMK